MAALHVLLLADGKVIKSAAAEVEFDLEWIPSRPAAKRTSSARAFGRASFAYIRRDGFVSGRAAHAGGEFTTPPCGRKARNWC